MLMACSVISESESANEMLIVCAVLGSDAPRYKLYGYMLL